MSTCSLSKRWRDSLGFTVSRDRKLRIWDLGSDACVRVIDLPTSLELTGLDHHHSSALVEQSTIEDGTSTSMSLFTTSPLLRVHSTLESIFLIVYIPAPLPSGNFLICYQVHLEGRSTNTNNAGASALGHIELVWQRGCDEQTKGWSAELRDLFITTEKNQEWWIWGLWDSAGETLVKKVELLKSSSDWSSISSPVTYSPLHGLALEEDLKAVSRAEDLAEFFMRRIVEPGRFSQVSLEEALQDYEDLLVDHEGIAAINTASDSLREQICSLVACTIKLEEDTSTGAPLYEVYWSALRKEWTTFVNLVEEYEAKERWPIGFAQGRQASDEPFVISRGRISLPIQEDASSELIRETLKGSAQKSDSYKAIVDVLIFANKLLRAIHPAALNSFERKLLEMLESQTSFPPESIADTLWTSQLQGAIEEDDTFALEEEFALLAEDVKMVVSKVLQIVQHSPSLTGKRDDDMSLHSLPELDAALCSDAITQITCDRLALVRMLNLLCFALNVGYLPHEETLDGSPAIEDLLGEVCATYHLLYAFDVLARRDGTIEVVDIEPSHGDEVVDDLNTVAQEMENLQFGREKVERNPENAISTPANLVHACILRRQLGEETITSKLSLSQRIYSFSVSAIQQLLFSKKASLQPIDLSTTLALLANDILKTGHPFAAAAFVQLFPRTPASHYLLARSHILCNEVELAARDFERVIPAFYRLEEEQSDFGSGLMEVVTPAIRRAKTTSDALYRFYQRVVLFYQHRPVQSHFFIAHFAKKAIDIGIILHDCNTRSLQEARFNSLLALEWYEDAYSHLVAIPYFEEQKRLLPDLISRMCEQGQVDRLLSLNFASLQVEVVNTLGFKARNSKSLEEVDFYFDLLYAFYVKQGDLKNAGATMWQMGTRLRQMAKRAQGLQEEENDNDAIRQLSIMEARCYLACINVLSQLEIKDAWFAHDTGGAEEEEGMESKLTSYVPSTCFHGRARNNLKIVNLLDIRRRYQVRLAQLELFSTRPQYSTSILTTDRNDANNVVSLFTSNDDFERAFTVARLLNIDRIQIYTALTDRCLELSQWEQVRKVRADQEGWSEHPLMQSLLDDQESPIDEDSRAGFLNRIDRCTTWTGSASQRAWRYLRLWLDMEEGQEDYSEKKIQGKYHLIILNRVLYWNQFSLLPSWLITWLRLNEQEFFIKSLLNHNLLEPALQESLKMITAVKTKLSRKRKVRSSEVYLPYLLLDELLKRSEEASPQLNNTGDAKMMQQRQQHGSFVELRNLAKEVRQAIEVYKDDLQRMQDQSFKERNEDQRRQRRYMERQEEGLQQITDVTMS